MELRHLRYFMAVADTLNFTRAAAKVHVTQSTLSHQIRQLEDDLGRPLFTRAGKRILLTESGQLFHERVRDILQGVDDAVGALKEAPTELGGSLSIAATHSFNVQLIPECLAAFMARFPRVRVRVEELSGDQICDGLASGALDLGVSYRPSTPRGLRFEPLFNEELKLVVSNRHPLAHHKRVRMVELNGERMTLLTDNFSTRRLLEECFVAAGARPTIVAELNAVSPMVELVKRTDLATIVSDNAWLGETGVVGIPLESPTPIRIPGLLWSPGPKRTMASRFMAETIRQRVLANGVG